MKTVNQWWNWIKSYYHSPIGGIAFNYTIWYMVICIYKTIFCLVCANLTQQQFKLYSMQSKHKKRERKRAQSTREIWMKKNKAFDSIVITSQHHTHLDCIELNANSCMEKLNFEKHPLLFQFHIICECVCECFCRMWFELLWALFSWKK